MTNESTQAQHNGTTNPNMEKDTIAKLVRLYTEIESVSESVKEVKDKAKEAGFDASILSAVAKAIVKNNVDELGSKSDEILRCIDVSRS